MKLVLAWLSENPEVMSALTGLMGALAGSFLKKNKGSAMEPLLKLLAGSADCAAVIRIGHFP